MQKVNPSVLFSTLLALQPELIITNQLPKRIDKKMSKTDFLSLFPIPLNDANLRPAHPDELTKATAKGHIHKVNPVWLPKPQLTNTVKKRRAKRDAVKHAIAGSRER